MKSIKIFRLLFLINSSILFTTIAPAQENESLNLSVGLGHPELLNAGIRFQMEQSQLGLSVGVLPGSDDDAFSVGGDYYYHFGGSSDFSARRPWFIKGGLNYDTV